MTFIKEAQHKRFEVSEINDYIRHIIEDDEFLFDIWMTGELSNVRFYQMGKQLYFTLTDGKSQINCVMYATFLKNLNFEPKDGLKVDIRGSMKMFHKRGSLSFQCVVMKEVGAGDKSQDLAKLKDALEKEGLFDSDKKRPIVAFPEHVAVITAPDSAAWSDFNRIIKSKCPHLTISIVAATMQGVTAPNSVKTAIQHCQSLDIDTIVIMRGGGSVEDLYSFNDESLVRATGLSGIPTITAIGHEVDTTLIDYISDLRVPTPTAAAQTIAEPFQNLQSKLPDMLGSAYESVQLRLQHIQNFALENFREIQDIFTRKMELKQEKTQQLLQRLQLANPLYKLEQGFSISRRFSTGEIIRSVSNLKKSDIIETSLMDGVIRSTVEEVNTHGKTKRNS